MPDRRRTPRRLHDAALALAVDGTLLLNAAHAFAIERHQPDAAELLLRQVLASGVAVFIGVPLQGRDRTEALRRLANGAADAAGHIVGQRRRRVRDRKSGRRES
jgi:hypothetical protein